MTSRSERTALLSRHASSQGLASGAALSPPQAVLVAATVSSIALRQSSAAFILETSFDAQAGDGDGSHELRFAAAQRASRRHRFFVEGGVHPFGHDREPGGFGDAEALFSA